MLRNYVKWMQHIKRDVPNVLSILSVASVRFDEI